MITLTNPSGEPGTSSLAYKDGRLKLELSGGNRLHIFAGQEFEPWTLVGPDGLRVVSVPGGELAIWGPDL